MNDFLLKEVAWVKRFIDCQTYPTADPKTKEIHRLLQRLDATNATTVPYQDLTKTLVTNMLEDRVRGKTIDEIRAMYPLWDVDNVQRPNLGLRGYLLDEGTDSVALEAARKLLLVADTINKLVASLTHVRGYVALPSKVVDYQIFREIAEGGAHIFYGTAVSNETRNYIDALDVVLFTQVTDFVQYGMSSLFDNFPTLTFVSMHGYRFLEISVSTGAKYYLPRTRIHYGHDESRYLCDICEASDAKLIQDGERALYLCEQHRNKG